MVVDIPDIVTYTNFGYHRLRGFWVAGGQIFPSPIDFYRRPYNTVALPCERVICLQINSQSYYFIFKNVGKDKPAKEQEKRSLLYLGSDLEVEDV